MPLASLDARVAELVYLDVVDVTPDGQLRLNASFVATCLAAHAKAPAPSEDIVEARLLARAEERGHVPSSPARLARTVLGLGHEQPLVVRV